MHELTIDQYYFLFYINIHPIAELYICNQIK